MCSSRINASSLGYGSADTDNTLVHEPLSATLAWLDEVIGREEDQEELEPKAKDHANSK
jgi:hypothetical protein